MHQSPKMINETVKRRLVDVPVEPTTSGWSAEFVKLPLSVTRDVFGSGGESLHALLSQMDTQHPDLERCLEDKIFKQHSIASFKAITGLTLLAVEHNRADLLPPLGRLDLLPFDVVDVSAKSFIRCMQSPQKRDEMRRVKKPQVIDLTTVSRKGEELWNTQPSSFESLLRYEDAYADEIVAAKRRATRFFGLGCTAMHAEVMRTVEAFQTQVADSYLGFNRLTFNAASVILAKWHGYNLTTPHILSDFPNERNYKVTVDPSRFRKLSWNFFARPEDVDIAWPYSPRVYPINEMEPLPPDLQEIVGLCENYHGYEGRPLFDHYAVMVPGIDYPPQREGTYTFRGWDGGLATFEDHNEARYALDKALLTANAFSAVVMGERDGKCYCLSVWG